MRDGPYRSDDDSDEYDDEDHENYSDDDDEIEQTSDEGARSPTPTLSDTVTESSADGGISLLNPDHLMS